MVPVSIRIRASIFCAFALLGATASAVEPSVGDYAAYSVNGTTEDALLLAHDPANSKFQIRRTRQGSPSVTADSWVSASQVQEGTQLQTNLLICRSLKGTVESVSVPAGTFTACRLQFVREGKTETTWIGHVPFGVIQSRTWESEAWVTRSLTQYRFGSAGSR